MSRKAVISFAPSALSDLEGILAWYMEQGVSEIGRRLAAEVIERIEALADHPDIGRVVPEFNITTLLELIHPPLRIVYRHGAGRIRVVRVWRSERLLKLD